MGTTSVRYAPVAGSRPSSAAPLVGPARDRSVLVAALLLVAGQLVLRGWLVAQRQYYADDLRLLHLADRSPLFSPSYLLDDYDGHLMPGAFLVAGLVERAAPLEWWPAAVSVIVLQALASLALLRVLWVLLGSRPVLLVPLAFGLFTPITLGSITWWAASLNSLPLQIGLAWFVAAAVRLAQTGRRRHAVSGTAALAFALAFYLKAVLLPPIALVVVAVVLLRDGVHHPLREAVRRAWALWAGTVVVLGVWAATYLSTRESDVVSDGSTSDVVVTVTTGFEALAPAVLSGPFRWVIFPPGTPLSVAPPWTVTAGVLVLAAALVWTCVRHRGALSVWLLTGGVVGAGLLMAALGRSALGLGSVAPLAYRYFAADAVLLPIAGALLVSLPLREAVRRRAGGRPWSARPWAAALTAVLVAAFVAAAVASTASHAREWQKHPADDYLVAARTALQDAGPAPLLDQLLPADLVAGLSAPANSLFGVYAPLRDRPEFAAATGELQLLDGAGHLVPARVEPVARVLPGPAPACGYPVPAGGDAALPLDAPAFDWVWTAALEYTADQDGRIAVALDDRAPVEAPVAAGTSTVFVRLTGPATTLRVTSPADGIDVCVHGGVLGQPVP